MTLALQIVVPAFNEAKRLPNTIALLRDWLASARPDWGGVEVIVVNNASTDDTGTVASALSSPELPITVIDCDRPGKGSAVRAGILTTTAEVVAFVDADGATSFDALGEAVEHIQRGADIAIASRALPGSVTMTRHSVLRETGAAAYRWSTARLVPGIRDTQCGFKVFRGALARRVLAETQTDGFSFDVEILGRARIHDATIVEFPVTWVDVPGSTFSPARHGLESFRQLAQIGMMLRRSAQDTSRVASIVRPVLQEPLVADLALDA